MQLTDVTLTAQLKASSTMGAVNAISEYCDQRYSDMIEFINGDERPITIAIPSTNEDNPAERVVQVTKAVYDSAVAYPQQIVELAESTSSSMMVSGQEVLDAIEMTLSDLKAQSEFLRTCLSDASATAIGYITKVRALAPGMISSVIERYSRFFENYGSSVEALRAYITSLGEQGYDTDQGDVIVLTNVNDYTGSVFRAALITVGLDVAQLTLGVLTSLDKIKAFVTKIGNTIQSAAKWAFNAAFGSLLTNYAKASGRATGILDFPIFQMTFTPSELSALGNAMDAVFNQPYGYSGDDYAHRVSYWASFSGFLTAFIAPTVAYHTKRSTANGTVVPAAVDVIVPSEPFNLCLRVGTTGLQENVTPPNKVYALQVFIVSDYGTFSSYSPLAADDRYINEAILNSLFSGMKHISSLCGMLPIKPLSWQHQGALWVTFANSLWDISNSSDWSDLAPLCKFVTHTAGDLSTNITIDENQYTWSDETGAAMFLISSLTYVFLNLHSFRYYDQDRTEFVLNDILFNPNFAVYTPPTPPAGNQPIEAIDADMDTSLWSDAIFTPYAKLNLLGTTIHYQTTQERANEILRTVLTITFITAVAVATTAFFIWRTKRKKQGELLHARLDALSWDITDPEKATAEKIEEWTQLRKKLKWWDKINNIIGVAAPAAVSSGFNVLEAVSDKEFIGSSRVESSLSNESDTTRNLIRSLIMGS